MADATKLVIGKPSSVLVGAYGAAEGACTDVGTLEGGISIEVSTERSEQGADSWLGPVIAPVIGRKVSGKFVMAEITLANAAIAMGLTTGAVAGTTLSYGENLGEYKAMFVNAPGPGAGTTKYSFWKVAFLGAVALDYKKDGKTLYGISFTVLEDPTQAAGQEFFKRVDTVADAVAPTVASTDPTDGAINQAITVNMDWVMSEAIAPGTVIAAHCWLMKADGTPVACVLTWFPSELKIRLDPAASLANATAYIGVLTTDITDLAGNPLAANSIVNFTTVA